MDEVARGSLNLDFLTGLVTPLGAASGVRPGPSDDFWYKPFSPLDGSVSPTAENALTLSTVWRGVTVLANTLAMLPLQVKRRLPDGGTEDAPGFRLWSVLHDRPNRWQTSFEWRQMGMGHCVLRGNFYNRIVSDGGFASSLIPLSPDRTRVVDQLDDGRLIYEYVRPEHGTTERLIGGVDMLHIKGFGSDGWSGLSVIDLMRRAVTGAVNMESFAAKFFSGAPTMRGFLKFPGRMKDDAKRSLENSFARSNSGSSGWHRSPVLEGGLEWQNAGVTNEDSQFLGSRQHTVPEFARFIGVPTALLMHTDKQSLYANVGEFMSSFFKLDMGHWFVNWESRLHQALFTETEQAAYFPKFNRADVLKGDPAAQAKYLETIVGKTRIMSRNEGRKFIGLNTIPGLDEFDAVPSAGPAVNEEPDGPREPGAFGIVVRASADRITVKEVAALRKLCQRHPEMIRSASALETAALVFYDKLSADIARSFGLSPTVARAYTLGRLSEFRRDRAVLDAWATEGGACLAEYVIGEHDGA